VYESKGSHSSSRALPCLPISLQPFPSAAAPEANGGRPAGGVGDAGKDEAQQAALHHQADQHLQDRGEAERNAPGCLELLR